MQTAKQIRVVVLGLVQQGDRLLLAEGYDPIKQRHFYRALGGGIEFGENSLDALKREFWEELQSELTNIEYLGCIESCFTYLEQPHHEIIQLYRCDLVERRWYQLDQFTFFDGEEAPIVARWLERDRIIAGDLWLVPEPCIDYL